MGVINPITLKFIGDKSLVANKYMEPENNKTPVRISLSKVDFYLGLMYIESPMKNSKKE